jgi:hypothetical protein
MLDADRYMIDLLEVCSMILIPAARPADARLIVPNDK